MIFRFVGWRCPKSGRIAHYFFYPSPGSLQLFQTHFCSLVWMTSCNNHSTSAFVVGFFHQAQSHKQALKGWTGWWGNFTGKKNWQKRESWISAISTTSWKPDLTTSSKPGQCYVFWCSGGRGPSSCSTHYHTHTHTHGNTPLRYLPNRKSTI